MSSAEKKGVPIFSSYPGCARGGVALAPMSGVTDAGMRKLAWESGAAYVVTEMVASDAYVAGDEEYRLRAEGQGIHPHVVQIAGCEAGSMAEAARLAEASGADAIDINMGCPAKRVTGGWSGSALMRDLDHATGLIEAVIEAVRLPVSVKMRLGWDDTSLNAPELARRAEQAGACLITVHGRTRQQFYKGHADWSAIRRVREAIAIPLVANGDIATVADARNCMAQSGADAVMVGRAATGKAWLPGAIGRALATGAREIVRPDTAERHQMLARHYAWLLTHFGDAAGLRHARKHLAAAMDDHLQSVGASEANAVSGLRNAILTSVEPGFVTAGLAEIFALVDQAKAA
jgi:tRNA-dihydrouridine synthase B